MKMLRAYIGRQAGFCRVGLVLALGGLGCNGPLDCVDIGVFALRVSVVDDRTGASLNAGSTIIAVGQATRDSVSLPVSNSNDAFLACCHGGTFSVIVRHAGYVEQTRSNIVVKEDGCGHPRTVSVEVRLTPVPGLTAVSGA